MKIASLTLLFLLALPFLTCQDRSNAKSVIYIQPFDDLPREYLQFVYSELSKFYPNVKIRPSIALPKLALNQTQTRYRADSLIQFLSRNTLNGNVTVGLTTKDISTTKDKNSDWGVMGLGYCPGKSCIASSYRLNRNRKMAQLFKVAIHELGHTRGIPHCPVACCYMRDAKGKNHKDEEIDFCSKCKHKLREAGWNFIN